MLDDPRCERCDLSKYHHGAGRASGDCIFTQTTDANPAAAMGRKRMAKLTSGQRTELAKKAAAARWAKPKATNTPDAT